MQRLVSRRGFLKAAGAGAVMAGSGSVAAAQDAREEPGRQYGISLAGWSLHRTIGHDGDKIPMLEMPRLAREEFDIGAIELVNRMLASDSKQYIDRFIQNAQEHRVKILLIMVDGEGSIGSDRVADREDAVKRHAHWIDIAADMGCRSIRMNWAGAPRGVMENNAMLSDFISRSVRPFRELCQYGEGKDINVIIENHGGPSSWPEAMERLMDAVNHPRFGTLPDFGNFPRKENRAYAIDVYDATDRLMNYAKAVSAKCYDFDPASGIETTLDYARLIEIVADKHGYDGFIGIEYEGSRLSEFDGIKACKKLLETLRIG